MSSEVLFGQTLWKTFLFIYSFHLSLPGKVNRAIFGCSSVGNEQKTSFLKIRKVTDEAVNNSKQKPRNPPCFFHVDFLLYSAVLDALYCWSATLLTVETVLISACLSWFLKKPIVLGDMTVERSWPTDLHYWGKSDKITLKFQSWKHG